MKGRPRTFDRDKAIENAMFLFWQHGYESTSLSQLKAAIGRGISAPSFYAAFGSKEALFKECVERYMSTFGKVTAYLWDPSLSPRDALEITLRKSAQMQCETGHPSGCMVGLGALSATSSEHTSVAEPLARSRKRTRDGIAAVIQRAADAGEFRQGASTAALTNVFSTFLFGLSIQARDSAAAEDLNEAVTEVMRLWDLSKA